MDYNVPLIEVINILRIPYKKFSGQEYKFIENGVVCDGWAFNIHKNQAYDFAGKGRPSGGPYKFVRDFLGLSPEETRTWFIENFNLHPKKESNEIGRIKARIRASS